MPYRPVHKSEELPALGAKREDFNYEFKSTVADAFQAELAKDVAAFANAAGGTILVGASEDKSTNSLQGWVKLSSTEASDARTAFNEAVTRRCSPVPVIDPQIIERAPGEFVVAVNVPPYSTLPIGVRVTTDQAKEGKAWDSWIIWVRVGTEAMPFRPEQIAMLMIPEVRHAMTLLDSIPKGKQTGICAFFRMPQMEPESARTKRSYLDLEGVRPLENVAIFRKAQGQKPGAHPIDEGIVHIPLSEIGAVWSVKEGDWCLWLKGQIQSLSGAPFYIPNS
jgi:hypothetical protein